MSSEKKKVKFWCKKVMKKMIMEMLTMRDEDEACPTTKTRTRTKEGWFFF